MWLVRAALRRPYTTLVLALALTLAATLALLRAPVDIFPDLGVPVIYVVQPYGGMSPSQMEGQIVTYYEYHFLYIAGIEHIESRSIQGMAMLKLYFHPGTDIAQSLAQVTAMAFRATSFMPPGTLPPFIVRFDAGSIPVGQLVFQSDTRSDKEIQDLALYRVRPVLATLPGVSAPPPFGGQVRTIVVYADPARMRAVRVSADDIAGALARSNLTLPAGNVRIGDQNLIAATNAMVARPEDLGAIPLRLGPGASVYLRDVARVVDGGDVVYNTALVDGRPTVYMPLTKRADASTLDVVRAIRAALPRMRGLLPPDIHVTFAFDQSIFVAAAIRGLVGEALLGALLTGFVVLLFLRSWRSALVVVLTIPLSVLAAVVALRAAGQTINIMTLGGLALAVGILVDEATVAIENIHVHLARGGDPARAVLDAMHEVLTPRFLAMIAILAIFLPAIFMVGVARALFVPLALAVGFAMVASYLVSSALVPVLSLWLLHGVRTTAHAAHGTLAAARDGMVAWSRRAIRRRRLVLGGYLGVCALALGLLLPRLGAQMFPTVDTGQLQLRIRAPVGTRLERTVDLVRQVDQVLRQEAGPGNVEMTLADVGNVPWTYPVNAVYVWNSGPQDAVLLASLRKGRHGPALPALEDRLRDVLDARFPGARFSFEAGDLVSQVMSFGASTPIEVTVAGKDFAATRAYAEKIATRLRDVASLRDVAITQALDYPTLDIRVDRARAGQLGLAMDAVGRALVDATSSSTLITPTFWVDPSSGVPYRVGLRVPERQVASQGDLQDLPIRDALLDDVAHISRGTTPGEIDHYNSQREITVAANIVGDDLGGAGSRVESAIASLGAAPAGTSVALHGQLEQMRSTLEGLRSGVALTVAVILLLLVGNFQSLRDPLAVLAPVPAVLVGVAVALWVSRGTLNVESLMGAIMAIGVSVASALLLVTMARSHHRAGIHAVDAAEQAVGDRMRPILMTGLAMIAGMIPVALALGEGGGQTAPLGVAVIGGLVASIVATLLIVPAAYAALWGERSLRSPSLHPDDRDLAQPDAAHRGSTP